MINNNFMILKVMEGIYGEWIDFTSRNRNRISVGISIFNTDIVVYITGQCPHEI